MLPHLQHFDPFSAEDLFFDVCRTNNPASLTHLNAQLGVLGDSLRAISEASIVPPAVAQVFVETAARIQTVASSISAAHLNIDELVQKFDQQINISSGEVDGRSLPLLCHISSSERVVPEPTSTPGSSSFHGLTQGSESTTLTTDESHRIMKTWCLQ